MATLFRLLHALLINIKSFYLEVYIILVLPGNKCEFRWKERAKLWGIKIKARD